MLTEREIDAKVATEIFGYEVFSLGQSLHEKTPHETRPLKNYSRDMECAWSVAERLRISIIPTEGCYWFAFAGPPEGWGSPAEFLEFLDGGDFDLTGAAVDENPARAICEAAIKLMEKRRQQMDYYQENAGEDGSEAVGIIVEATHMLN